MADGYAVKELLKIASLLYSAMCTHHAEVRTLLLEAFMHVYMYMYIPKSLNHFVYRSPVLVKMPVPLET